MNKILIDELSWPVVIWHQHSSELTYIKNQSQWCETVESASWMIAEGDKLIGSNGICCEISTIDKGAVNALDCNDVDLNKFVSHLKEHMHNRGICCLSKLYIPDVSSAFKIIENAENE